MAAPWCCRSTNSAMPTRICDRLVLLSGGRVMGVGTLAELTDSARLPIGTDLEEVFLALA